MITVIKGEIDRNDEEDFLNSVTVCNMVRNVRVSTLRNRVGYS